MSREAYKFPPARVPTPRQPASPLTPMAGGSSNEVGPQMQYLCGDCGLKFQMRRGDRHSMQGMRLSHPVQGAHQAFEAR
ncbi:metallothionein-I transcription activator [Verticillium dahliae]|nr:metallothionein-I transcription activator [Verticillium dahliae]